jgi:hypothetical protein
MIRVSYYETSDGVHTPPRAQQLSQIRADHCIS